MEKKSFLAGIAASALVVGGGIATMAAVNAQQAPAGGPGEAVVVTRPVNVPAGSYKPDVVEAEAVAPAPEPEVTVAPVEPVESAPVVSDPVTPAPAPVEPAPVKQAPAPAPAPAPADPVEAPPYNLDYGTPPPPPDGNGAGSVNG